MDEPVEDRIILIKGDKSKWYEQAIFIVKPGAAASLRRADIVAEAENILAAYLGENADIYNVGLNCFYDDAPSGPPPLKTRAAAGGRYKRGRFDLTLNIAMLICCVVIAALLLMAIRG